MSPERIGRNRLQQAPQQTVSRKSLPQECQQCVAAHVALRGMHAPTDRTLCGANLRAEKSLCSRGPAGLQLKNRGPPFEPPQLHPRCSASVSTVA